MFQHQINPNLCIKFFSYQDTATKVQFKNNDLQPYSYNFCYKSLNNNILAVSISCKTQLSNLEQ